MEQRKDERNFPLTYAIHKNRIYYGPSRCVCALDKSGNATLHVYTALFINLACLPESRISSKMLEFYGKNAACTHEKQTRSGIDLPVNEDTSERKRKIDEHFAQKTRDFQGDPAGGGGAWLFNGQLTTRRRAGRRGRIRAPFGKI